MSALPGSEPPTVATHHEIDAEAWRARALAAEAEVQDLHRRLAAAETAVGAREPEAHGVSFFESTLGATEATGATEAGPAPRPQASDGFDVKIAGLVVWSVAIVAAMVAVLSLVNNGVLSFFTWLMVLATGGLVWVALRLRPAPTTVSTIEHMVVVESRRRVQRFDLRAENTLLEVVGEPGEETWCVRILHPGEPPVTVSADDVDAADFMARLREFRPEL